MAAALAATVAYAPFKQHDWPNPRGATPLPQAFVSGSPLTLRSAPVPTPFAQADWPVPASYRQPLREGTAATPLTLQSSGVKPFLQTEWPVPDGYRQPRRGGTEPTALTLRDNGVAPFSQSDWPVPKGYAPTFQLSYSLDLLQSTLKPGFVASISVTLTDANNAPLANLTGLRWAWWDQPVVNSQASPSVTGTAATTDASGVFSVTTLAGSTLTAAGQIGWLEVTDSDGTSSQSPVANVAAGPITVQ